MQQRTFALGLVCLALLGTAACEGDPNTAEYWVKQLEERKTRDNAIKEIRKDRKPIHVDGLVALSKVADDPNRADTALLLGQIGEKFPETREKVGPALVDMVDFGVGGASDKASRQKNNTNKAVADAVARIGYQNGAETLARLLDSKDNNTRLAAVTGLGVVKNPAAVDKLLQVVNEDDNNFMVKNAIKALGNIGDAKAVPSLVRLMFFERAVSFYSEASYALFQIGKPAVPALVDTLNGKTDHIGKISTKVDPWIVKAKCIQVLVDIGDPKGTEGALTVLKSADTGEPSQLLAKSFVVRPVGQAGAKDAAPLLRKQALNVDITQAEGPLEALAMLGDRAFAADVLKLASRDGYYADCKAADFDEEQCKGSEVEVRTLRLTAGTRLGGAADLAAVEKMEAAEKDTKLKEALGKDKARLVAAKECGDKVDCWVGKLKDPSAKVRDKAAWELAWRKDPATANAMLDALTDEDLHVRAALFVGLLRLLPKDGADKVAKQLSDEAGKVQFLKINEDLKRLEIKLRRGY